MILKSHVNRDARIMNRETCGRGVGEGTAGSHKTTPEKGNAVRMRVARDERNVMHAS